MIYRDMPPESFLKEVVLPMQTFERIIALAHIGESVLNMKTGWVLAYVGDRYYCMAEQTPVVFNATNPMEAIEAFQAWEQSNGKTGNNKS